MRFLVTSSTGGGEREVEASSVAALIRQEQALVSLSYWCEDPQHLHYPDGQWHAGDWLLDEMKEERL